MGAMGSAKTCRAARFASLQAGKGWRASAPVWRSRRYRWGVTGRSGAGWWHGPADTAGLGDPVQWAGAGVYQQGVTGCAGPARSVEHKAFLARIVEDGPIRAAVPALAVRSPACDLIRRFHERVRLSVSDDTVYRALKGLGFSHVSARPRAYKQC